MNGKSFYQAAAIFVMLACTMLPEGASGSCQLDSCTLPDEQAAAHIFCPMYSALLACVKNQDGCGSSVVILGYTSIANTLGCEVEESTPNIISSGKSITMMAPDKVCFREGTNPQICLSDINTGSVDESTIAALEVLIESAKFNMTQDVMKTEAALKEGVALVSMQVLGLEKNITTVKRMLETAKLNAESADRLIADLLDTASEHGTIAAGHNTTLEEINVALIVNEGLIKDVGGKLETMETMTVPKITTDVSKVSDELASVTSCLGSKKIIVDGVCTAGNVRDLEKEKMLNDTVVKMQKQIDELTAHLIESNRCYTEGKAYDVEAGACDENDCLLNNCHPDAECIDGLQDYTCQCKSMYVGDGRSCRPVEPCGQDQTTECTANERCIPGDDGMSNICVCNEGMLPDSAGNCDAAPHTFWDALDHWYISQYLYEGSEFRGVIYPEAFWVDECASGGDYLIHSIDCGAAANVITQYCRYSHDDTEYDRNWIEFHTKYPVSINRWRIKGRNHSPNYLGNVRLHGLDPEQGWMDITSETYQEPGTCTWSSWMSSQQGTKAFTHFRFSMCCNVRNAYHAFSAFDIELNSSPRPLQYLTTGFQDAVHEVTYSDSITQGSSSFDLFADGRQIFTDECRTLDTPTPTLAVHGLDGVYGYGNNWIKFEMKIPVTMIGYRIKARRNFNKDYIGNVLMLGSNDGVSWEDLQDSPSANYEPGECLMGPHIAISETKRKPFKYFKLELWGGSAKGYQSFSQLIVYSPPSHF